MTTKVPSEFLSTGAIIQVVSTTKTDTFGLVQQLEVGMILQD